MDRHVIAIDAPAVNCKIAEAELQAALSVNKKRKWDYSEQQVKLVTEDARQVGPTWASKKHPDVSLLCTDHGWIV